MDAEVRPTIRDRDREEKFASANSANWETWAAAACWFRIARRRRRRHNFLRSNAGRSRPRGRGDGRGLSVTNSLAAFPLAKYGTDAQRQKYLQRLAHGAILGAFCLTEPQAGSDSAAIATSATRHGAKYHLNGTKSWVTNGGEAGVYVVFAKTDAWREREA